MIGRAHSSPSIKDKSPVRMVATDQAAFHLHDQLTSEASKIKLTSRDGCSDQPATRCSITVTHYEVMLIQIFCPTSKRPEGVKNLTSGGLKAVTG